MPLKKLTRVVPAEWKDLRLDHCLAEWLAQELSKDISRSKVRKLIMAGAVNLNGQRCRIASKPLRIKAKIDVYLDESLLLQDAPQEKDQNFKITKADFVYEDEYIIVVNKPPGLPTQPTLDRKRANLYQLLEKWRQDELAPLGKIKDAYIGLHHRLDRDTSGVILFTKKKEANLGVSQIFKEHLAQKTYIALVENPKKIAVPNQWKVDNFLKKDPVKKGKMKSVRSGGDHALTEFTVLERWNGYLLIQAKPLTGRMHQIRVHLAEYGLPIVGDDFYGTDKYPCRVLLHAAQLTFPHPISKIKISVQAPLPQDFTTWIEKLSGRKSL